MTKLKFLLALNEKLASYPQKDVEERLSFYSEMIEDRIEEGLTEEEAVAAVGSVDEIVAQIIADIPLTKFAAKKIKPKRRLKAWEIVLLVVGSPIWFSLLVAAAAVAFSLYVALWAIIGSLWAVAFALIACAGGMMIGGVGFAVGGYALSGIAVIAAGLVCVGLSIFLFYGCKAATKGTALQTKKMAMWIKQCFVKKEGA